MPVEVTQPDKIASIDMLDYVNRIDRYLHELQNCASATRNETTEKDIERWIDLAADLRRKYDLYIKDPELDAPNYHPNKQALPAVPVVADKQNPDVMNVSRTLVTIRTQCVYGEEGERVSGLSEKQKIRHKEALDRLDAILEDIKGNREVDSPNSPDQKPGESK